MKLRFDRRRFLRGTFGSLGAIIAARAGWLFPEGQQVLTRAGRVVQQDTAVQPPVNGELYAGFVLLPDGASIPPFVQCAPAPILCQVDNEQDPDVVAYRGETLWFDSIEGLASNLSYPTYVPTSLPQNIEFMHGYIIRFVQSGNIFVARSDFGIVDNLQPLISLSAQAIYPRPYPVWPIHIRYNNHERADLEQEDIVITPEKVNFTATPGLMLPTIYGHVLHWISQDILYTLTVEHSPRSDAAVEITKSLVEI